MNIQHKKGPQAILNAGEGEAPTLKRHQVGEFQRGLDAYLKKRGLFHSRRKKSRPAF